MLNSNCTKRLLEVTWSIAQSWNGLTQCNKVQIERVQRAATRFILNYPNMSYTERLSALNLLPLATRRDMLDLIFFL